MSESTESAPLFGSPELRLPDDLRGPLKAHMENLRNRYVEMGWAGRGGFGSKPALIVIDLALWWTKPDKPPMGSHIDPIVESTCVLLKAARAAGIPIFFGPRMRHHAYAAIVVASSRSAQVVNVGIITKLSGSDEVPSSPPGPTAFTRQ